MLRRRSPHSMQGSLANSQRKDENGFCRKFSFEVICSMLSPYDPR
jgi:hypothetical protein